MIGRNSFILTLTLILTVATAWGQSESVHQESSLLPSLEYQRPAFEFTEVVDGVYCASGTENLPVWCNAIIIVNESDVIIVDSHCCSSGSSRSIRGVAGAHTKARSLSYKHTLPLRSCVR